MRFLSVEFVHLGCVRIFSSFSEKYLLEVEETEVI